MNSLNESNCCLTRPFSSKNELMTTQASSCARVERKLEKARRKYKGLPSPYLALTNEDAMALELMKKTPQLSLMTFVYQTVPVRLDLSPPFGS